MKGRSHIQWGYLVFLIVILLIFEEIHLQVIHYNLFLILLISITFAGIIGLWALERRGPGVKEGNRKNEDEGYYGGSGEEIDKSQ
jgi:hypothetical protein